MEFNTLKNDKIYLDHNATTPLSLSVQREILAQIHQWGNPSSIHWAGRGPKMFLRESRNILGRMLNVSPLELVFTSGGTEANNQVIKGVFQTSERPEYITTTVEHPSVLKTFQFLESQGAQVHYLTVNREGQLDLQQYEKLLTEKTALVSVMMANNETGVLFPIGKLTKMAHKVGALFHTDAVQAFGKIPLDLKALNVDFASFSAHKFYALKGCGVLFTKKDLPPLLLGGSQERHRRGGTENVLSIHALGEMATYAPWVGDFAQKTKEQRDLFEKKVLAEISGAQVTGQNSERLPNTSHFIFSDIDGETLLMNLDVKGFAVSTGAACSSGSSEPSPVLLSMGFLPAEAQRSLRVSLGWATTSGEMDLFFEELKNIIFRLRKK